VAQVRHLKKGANSLRSNVARVEAPNLYWKMEQIGGEWVTRQLAYLSKSDVAALLHISERSIYDFVNRPDNPLPHHRIPGSRMMLFRPDEVEKWLESNKE
jgi:excisionase family DNA binding protein